MILGLTAIIGIFPGVGIHGRRRLRIQLVGEGMSSSGFSFTHSAAVYLLESV